MAKLSYARRKKLSVSDFLDPKHKRFPVPDAAHMRAALSAVKGGRSGVPASPEIQAKAKRVAKRRFPSIKVSGLKKKGAMK